MTGPEFQPGWRDEFVERGWIIRIEARHHQRKRLPRGHEIARQMARRGIMQMVEDPIYEWVLIIGRGRIHAIRHTPGGFQVAGDYKVFRTIREAAISKIGASGG